MSTRIIKINRGDSFEFILPVPTSNFSCTDAVYFALMYPHQKIEDAIILKGYSGSDPEVDRANNKIKVKLTHNDTKYLAPGVYYYTVKLHVGGSLEDMGASEEPSDVRTIIERTKFIVNE